jgi:hypothetical protein
MTGRTVIDQKDVSHQPKGDDATGTVANFARSFVYNLAQKPVNAVVQEVNQVTDSHMLPKLEFMSPLCVAPEGSTAQKAQKAGEIMAVVPWVLLGSKVLREAECLSGAGIAVSSTRAGIAGSAYGAFLQPVQDSKDSFAVGKLKNALEIGAGSAAFVGLQKGVVGDNVLSGGRQLLAGETAGLGAGFVTENTRSILDKRKLLNLSENLQSVAPYAVLGTAAALRNFTIIKTAKIDPPRYDVREDLVWDVPHKGAVARDLNAARRANDVAAGVIPTVKDSKIFDELADNNQWQVFRNRDNKQLFIDKTTGTVAKLFNLDELTDQAAALKKIEGEFGVTVPQNVVLHMAEDKAALTMSYVEHKTGQDVYVLANSAPTKFALRNRQADYIDLYEQGESLANEIHQKLNADLFFGDMHDENWGFTEKTIRNWRVGMSLKPENLIVTDPVTRWDAIH